MEPARRRICRVISDYQSAYPDPLIISAGDRLRIGERKSEWPGWLWCTTQQGKDGWVPQAYVAREGNTGLALDDYDATELSVRAGEDLFAAQEESGWLWCTNQRDQSGWVPAENLRCKAKND
jgi:hypothetical protein